MDKLEVFLKAMKTKNEILDFYRSQKAREREAYFDENKYRILLWQKILLVLVVSLPLIIFFFIEIIEGFTFNGLRDILEKACVVTFLLLVLVISFNAMYPLVRNRIRCIIAVQNNRYFYIDKKGEKVSAVSYDDAYRPDKGRALVLRDNRWGFINSNGREVIPPRFSKALWFSEGLAPVEIDGKWGYINRRGKPVIPSQYELAFCFSEGLAAVCREGKWGYIDKKDRLIIQPRFTLALGFSEGLAAVREEGKWGFFDKKLNKIVIKPQYEEIHSFHEGYAAVKAEGKWGFVEKRIRSTVILPQYERVRDFKKGWAAVFKEGKWGYIFDPYISKRSIACQFDDALSFYLGVAAVKKNGKWGYIDTNGKLVVDFGFEGAQPFHRDLMSPPMACMKIRGSWGLRNMKKFLIEPQYEELFISR